MKAGFHISPHQIQAIGEVRAASIDLLLSLCYNISMEKFNHQNQDIENTNENNGWDSLATEAKEETVAEAQKLSQKENVANSQAFRSMREWQKDDPETTVEELAATEEAIEKSDKNIELSDREARAKELAKYGYTGYED